LRSRIPSNWEDWKIGLGEEGIWTVSGALESGLESGLDRVGRLAGGQFIWSVI